MLDHGVEPAHRFQLDHADASMGVYAFDLLIRTAARVDGVPLVTRNTSDFERIPGLHDLCY